MAFKKNITLALVTAALVTSQSLMADAEDRRQAKRIFDRLTGVNPTTATIDAMEALLIADPTGRSAADYATQIPLTNPESAAFYNVTLKNFAAPWTNEAQTPFTDLNDYSATIVGVVRDGLDFRRILYDDIVYTGVDTGTLGPYQMNNNDHYADLEDLDPNGAGNLADPGVLQFNTQSAATGNAIPTEAAAGIMTSRAASMAFYSDGTNRAMFRFTLMNHLCTDLEPLKDVSRTPDRVRVDVTRSPGGDSRIFLNSCVGCHAGMDGLAGAYAHYEWDYTNTIEDGRLVYRDVANPLFDPDTGVSIKHNNAETTFPSGHYTTDASWINYWRNGQNALLGWTNNRTATTYDEDDKGHARGVGAKSMGEELANSHAFAQCQVDKVFEAVCLRGPTEFIDEGLGGIQDRIARDNITNLFKTTYNYDLRQVFVDVAAHCKGN